MALEFCQTKMSQRKLWGVILILVQFFTLIVYVNSCPLLGQTCMFIVKHAFLGGSIYYGQDIPDNFWQTSSYSKPLILKIVEICELYVCLCGNSRTPF